MIYTLRIKCVWGIYLAEPFERTVEIDSRTTLAKLHEYIQVLTDFDNDHCYDFFVGKTPRDIRNSLGRDSEFGAASNKLKKVTLADVFPLAKGQYLYYWFDFGDDWKFQISAKGEQAVQPGIKYPRVIAEKGPKPIQYPEFEE